MKDDDDQAGFSCPKRNTKLIIMISFVVLIVGVSALLIAMSPVSSLHSKPEDFGFELVCQTKILSADIPILKYVSKRTGIHVIIAKVEGPSVSGFFTLGTETDNDDGLPHTLEHLIFLGSEDFPYKGVLDILANRCIADGTNAWTDVDHTAYTVTTAGSAGFFNLLPIYLEHLLYPTLTESGFITEVYHVTGKGEDAGVVYSEMQARENTGYELTYNDLIRSLYPAPSGYRQETGGKMKNLRDSITNQKIIDYHKAMYRPENLHVIIVGQVEPTEVFQAMKAIEDKVVSKGAREPFSRTWQSPVPSFDKTEELEVVYASDDETTGIVRIGWRGPSIVTNASEVRSMNILMDYLTDLSVSPLPKVFVEVDEPLASSVSQSILENSVTSCILTFSGVPTNKINEIKPLLLKTMLAVANEYEIFDMEILRNILKNNILQEDNLIETRPHYYIAQNLITDFLFGNNCDDLNKFVNKKSWYEHLLTQPSSYWIHLMKKYLISSPYAIVRGIPSKAEAKAIQNEEQQRVRDRVRALKDDGLQLLVDKLENAKNINEIAPPDAMLEAVPVASVKSIKFHSLQAYSNLKNVLPIDVPMSHSSLFDMTSIPIKIQVDDVNSNFVEMVAILDTSPLDADQRMYLELLMDLVLESPMQVGDERIPYEDVVKGLNADTINSRTVNGISAYNTYFLFGSYVNYLSINIKVEMAKYEKGVYWLKNVLSNVVMDPERIKVKANKLLNSIGEYKRSGRKMLSLMYNHIVFESDTCPNRINALRQEVFLTELLADLNKKSVEIIDNLKKVYHNITDPDRIVIHMASNLKKLSALTDIAKPWHHFSCSPNIHYRFSSISDSSMTTDFSKESAVTGFVTGIGSVESSFIHQVTKAMTNYCHIDVAPLMTAISYLTQLEGPMWKEIRGKGLAYSYAITLKVNEGTLALSLARAAQVTGSYIEATKLIKRYLNGTDDWDPLLFESAKSSLLYEVIRDENQVPDVTRLSLFAYYRNVPHDYNRVLMKSIADVTISEMASVAKKYMSAMIDPMQSKVMVVCPPTRVDEVKTEFDKLGHSIEIVKSLADSEFA